MNHLALEKQLDELLLYKQWGVQGIKFGFVNVGSQRWTRWLHDAIRKPGTSSWWMCTTSTGRPAIPGRIRTW